MELFGNNAASTLNGTISAVATSLAVNSALGFPTAGQFRILVDTGANIEYMLVTAVSGTTFTVTRGQEATTAVAHGSGVRVVHIVTAGAIAQLKVDALVNPGILATDTGTILQPASAYTLAGSNFGVTQAGNTLWAANVDTSTNSIKTALIAASLPTGSPWYVDIACNDMPFAYSVQYPQVGVCVSTGTTSGATAYAMERYWNGTSQGWHGESFHPTSTRISVFNEQSGGLFGDAAMFRARLLNDATNLHFQVSQDGFFWTDWFSQATPSSLAFYGFLIGSGSGSGSTGAISALIYRNKFSASLNVPQVAVTSVTAGSPNVVSTAPNPHNLFTGDLVAIQGVGGVSNVNTGTGNNNSGVVPVVVLTSTSFQLFGTSGSGSYTSGGTVTCCSR